MERLEEINLRGRNEGVVDGELAPGQIETRENVKDRVRAGSKMGTVVDTLAERKMAVAGAAETSNNGQDVGGEDRRNRCWLWYGVVRAMVVRRREKRAQRRDRRVFSYGWYQKGAEVEQLVYLACPSGY